MSLDAIKSIAHIILFVLCVSVYAYLLAAACVRVSYGPVDILYIRFGTASYHRQIMIIEAWMYIYFIQKASIIEMRKRPACDSNNKTKNFLSILQLTFSPRVCILCGVFAFLCVFSLSLSAFSEIILPLLSLCRRLLLVRCFSRARERTKRKITRTKPFS